MDIILHRKERLIITAIEIIDELGIQGLSTREIARREGVSEATLFRHYKNKNSLLIAVLDSFSKFDEELYETTRLKGYKPVDAIKFLMSKTMEYYENYPAMTSISQAMDVIRYIPELTDKVNDILSQRSNFIIKLIDEAKEAGDLKTEINSVNLADILIGFCRETCLRWRVNKEFSLNEETISTLDKLFDTLV